MTSICKRVSTLVIGAVLALSGARAVPAEEAWPATRTITIICACSAGSGPDVLARALAQRLSASLKQAIVVDNRPGAAGVIAIGAVVKAPNDGYTLLYATASNAVIWPAVSKSVPYDTTRDLVPIAQTAEGGSVLLVNSEVPVKNLNELIALVKANPDKYSYGTWGVGSSGQLMMEWLKKQTGARMNHVPYRTSAQMLTELASGVLKICWADPSTSLTFMKGGKVRGIAISGNIRGPQMPDIPTLGEQGYKFDTVGWFGVFAPAGTNPAIVKRLSEEINKAQASPEFNQLMHNINLEPPPNKTQAQFRDIVVNDLATWKKIATDANISADSN